MADRIINPFLQYFDDNGNPLSGGEVFFYEPGTTTPKDTFSDNDLSVPNTNPLVLDASGRAGPIFLDGEYRAIIKDSAGVTIDDQDDINAGAEGEFGEWSSGAEYNTGDIVRGSDGNYYQSITNGNSGNDPVSSPANWQEIRFINVWNSNVGYDIGEVVVGSDGRLYASTEASNSGNDPTTGASEWIYVSKKPTPENNILTAFKNLVCKQATADTADIDADSVLLKDAVGDVYEASNVNLTVDITVSGANGLDTGSEAASTWYYLFVIYNPETNTVAGLLSASFSAPTLPSGYTYFGLVGAIFNTSGSSFKQTHQVGNDFLIDQTTVLSGGGSTSIASIDISDEIPPIATRVDGLLNISNGNGVSIYATNASTFVIADAANPGGGSGMSEDFAGPLLTAQTIYYQVTGGSVNVFINGGGY